MSRKLPPKLKDYFDEKLKDAVLTDPTKVMILAAMSCEGITESGGDNHGCLVELFQSVVTKPVAQPWCLDFVQACIAYAEAITGKISPVPATELVTALSVHVGRVPKPGDILQWRFKDSINKGHCGILLSEKLLTYQTIEGNTGPGAGIERNGDGVYQKVRVKGGSAAFIEIGFLPCFS